VGVVVHSGYSFNLDGTAIYLTMASLFIADALGNPLSIGQQISLLIVWYLRFTSDARPTNFSSSAFIHPAGGVLDQDRRRGQGWTRCSAVRSRSVCARCSTRTTVSTIKCGRRAVAARSACIWPRGGVALCKNAARD